MFPIIQGLVKSKAILEHKNNSYFILSSNNLRAIENIYIYPELCAHLYNIPIVWRLIECPVNFKHIKGISAVDHTSGEHHLQYLEPTI